ncbi:efflux RND transporter periplasmic adaptor subunit [Marinicella sp. W31]|uniref:efflux RND transporter periplasmic adaptor subunit n=1 Tax=Marinicella sp. W31 TaxID=3023713 RepID=UPI0037583190
MISNKNNIVYLLLFVFLLSACGGKGEPQSTEIVIRPVKFHTVSRSTMNVVSSYPATITAANTTELSFQVGGKVIEFDLTESESVSAGQMIARLDDQDYRNQFNALKAQYDNALSEYNRSESLFAQQAIAKNVVEQRKSQKDVLKAQLDVAEKALNDTVLKAPYSGTVSTINIENFQNIQPLQSIITIISETALEANVNIPASDLSDAPNNDILEAIISFEVAPELMIPATFKEIDLTADQQTQTYKAKFQFEAPNDSLILPGMNGTLSITTVNKDQSEAQAIQIPVSAVQSDANQQFVWIIDQTTMTVHKRPIEVKAGVGSMITLKSGLEIGETVAAAGGAYLAENMKIKEWVNQ